MRNLFIIYNFFLLLKSAKVLKNNQQSPHFIKNKKNENEKKDAKKDDYGKILSKKLRNQ